MTNRWAGAVDLAVSLGLSSAAVAATPTIASGAYDNTLLLAVGPGGEVSGYFSMSQPGPPQIDCIASFRGKLAGASGPVTAFDAADPKADVINGRIADIGDRGVRITLPSEPPGCGNIWSFANKDDPSDFTLQKTEPWTSVRVVKAAKAYFSPTPGAAHGRAYIVKGDGVGVRTAQAGWVQADFVGDAHTTSGWLKETDLYPP
jgi:hypothetical protein